MGGNMVLRLILAGSALLGSAFADMITLRDGRKLEGSYLGGDSRQVRMALGDKVETFAVTDVWSILFGATPPEAKPAPAAAEPVAAQESSAAAASATAQPAAPAELPVGTKIVVRMIDAVDSQRDKLGQTYRASLDEAISLNGKTIAARGADATVKLIDDKKAGKLSGKSEITLDLVTLSIDGRMVDVHTADVTEAGASQTQRSAGVIGGTAAVGAIIGAIAGGGRGAGIGALSGAGAGTAVQVLTKGAAVKIPSETRLSFTLDQPLRP
jgi:hypothetical protein